jgi:hypothetical protein
MARRVVRRSTSFGVKHAPRQRSRQDRLHYEGGLLALGLATIRALQWRQQSSELAAAIGRACEMPRQGV